MEVLRLEQLLRPLRRQLPSLNDRADEVQAKLKVRTHRSPAQGGPSSYGSFIS